MTHASPFVVFLELAAAVCALLGACQAGQWQAPQIKLPADAKHPVVACTPAELERLRAAWKAAGAEHDVVASAVAQADRILNRIVTFPPRGGQHNQWYQCDKCQLALKTVDDTHHKCPQCGKVYTGEPYDDVIFAHVHGRNLSDMAAAAWAYAITGEAKYADFAAKVLLGYAQRYQAYPYHSASRDASGWTRKSGGHLFEQTLNEASSMASTIAPAWDLIHDSPALSDADREAIRTGLLVPMLRNIDKNKSGMSNWQTWHNAAMLWGGAVLGDAEWVRKAIEDPPNGFLYQMKASVSSDGMWYENSWGYHFYTLGAMVKIVEGARRLGIDLWGHPSLKKMFTLAAEYAMPDGSLPRFGDDVHTTVSHASVYLEFAYHAYREPAMLAYLSGRATWESVLLGRQVAKHPPAPAPTSKVFPGAGHAILRTRPGAPGAGLAAAFTFGPYGGFHGHFDKLSFVFFGHKQELGVDPGRAGSQAYRLPIRTRWYKATISHNAVLVDESPQKPAAGKLERFAASESCAAAVATCDQAYPGVKHRRMLCLTPGYLVVLDDLVSSKERRYDWVYHSRGSGVQCAVATEAGKLGDRYPGQEYVQNVKAGTTAEAVSVRFDDKNVTTYLTMASEPQTEVRIGDGVGGSILDRVPMAMVTRRGRGAQFAAVLEPVAKGSQATVKAVTLRKTPDGVRITVDAGGASAVVALTDANEVTVTLDGKAVLEGKD